MKVLNEPTTYLLEDMHKTGTIGTEIVFVHRNAKGELVPGVTNEEIVEMMIQRFYALQKKKYSSEGDVVLKLFQVIKKTLNMRIDSKGRRTEKYRQRNEALEATTKG